MLSEQRIVDNRTFLLGLDYLYRELIKRPERGELLACARRVAATLKAAPADVPVEGYYAEDKQLIEYFRLIRALQAVNEKFAPGVMSLPEFNRLLDVMTSGLYGRARTNGKLLPVGRDALSESLRRTMPEWNVARLTATAYSVARETDDFSLVGLAALAQDALVIAALRESVVLYAEVAVGCASHPPPPKYIWRVDKELAQQAQRFIDTFNELFGEGLPPANPEQIGWISWPGSVEEFAATIPPAKPEHAEIYWLACKDNKILGRCARLGYDDSVSPTRQYHWAICSTDSGSLCVQEFWHPEVWNTKRYRSALRFGGKCPIL